MTSLITIKRIVQMLVLTALQFSFGAPVHTAPGDLDPAFGVGGKVTRDFFGNRDEARAVAIQPNGQIVIAGFARSGTDQGPDSALEDFAVGRYNPDGSLDANFGVAGDMLTDFGGEDRASAVVIQPNGQIVVVGGTCSGPDFDICGFALVRYNPDGTPDTGFGVAGQVTTHFPGFVALPFGLAVQRDGKIVVTGWVFDGAAFDFALARYHRNGRLDTSFGNAGLVTTDFGAGDDFGVGVIIEPSGKIVMSGTAFGGTNFDFALARYNTRRHARCHIRRRRQGAHGFRVDRRGDSRPGASG
jgi:uncharacterized delta-60 repeat protein